MTKMQIEKTTYHYTQSVPGIHVKLTITVPSDDSDWQWSIKTIGMPAAVLVPTTLTHFKTSGSTFEQSVDRNGCLTVSQSITHGCYWNKPECTLTPDELAAMFKIEER